MKSLVSIIVGDRLTLSHDAFRLQSWVKNGGVLCCRVHTHMCDLVCLVSKLSPWSHRRTNLTDEKEEGVLRGEESAEKKC